MDRIAAMQSFVRTVERGSFAAAASGSGLTAAMVGNHVRFLEARLGAQLLNRTTRRHGLTELGRGYFERCRSILAEIDAAEASAAEARAVPRGLLRVTAPMVFGATLLPRALAEYLRLHPEVEVDLVLQDRRADLLADGLDAAIRVGRLPDSGLIARALAPFRFVVCAAPAYLADHPAPTAPADLARHQCLDFSQGAEPGAWRFDAPGGGVAVPVRGRLRINSGQALRVAALEGIGIALVPEVLVADDLAAGRLVQVLGGHPVPALPVHLLTPPERHPTPKLRSFVAFMGRRLGGAAAAAPKRRRAPPPA